MSNFEIDFIELAILAEACIPPTPIARAYFWMNLTNRHWHKMSEVEREHLFTWIQKNPWYAESLETQEDTKIFHARFDPNNQYLVNTNYAGKEEEHRAFKMGDLYYTGTTTHIAPEYIIEVNKLNNKQ